MNNQNIIVYRFNSLYQILKELEEDINFRIIEISNEKSLINFSLQFLFIKSSLCLSLRYRAEKNYWFVVLVFSLALLLSSFSKFPFR